MLFKILLTIYEILSGFWLNIINCLNLNFKKLGIFQILYKNFSKFLIKNLDENFVCTAKNAYFNIFKNFIFLIYFNLIQYIHTKWISQFNLLNIWAAITSNVKYSMQLNFCWYFVILRQFQNQFISQSHLQQFNDHNYITKKEFPYHKQPYHAHNQVYSW